MLVLWTVATTSDILEQLQLEALQSAGKLEKKKAKNEDCPNLGLSDSKSDRSLSTLNSFLRTGAKIGSRGKTKICSEENSGPFATHTTAYD